MGINNSYVERASRSGNCLCGNVGLNDERKKHTGTAKESSITYLENRGATIPSLPLSRNWPDRMPIAGS